MFKFLGFIAFIISFSVSASTNGGGLVLDTALVSGDNVGYRPWAPEAVFHIGETKYGTVKFGYAQWVDRSWQVQRVEIKKNNLIGDPALSQALTESSYLKVWAPVQP